MPIYSDAVPAPTDGADPAPGEDDEAGQHPPGQGGDGHHRHGHRHQPHCVLHTARITHIYKVSRIGLANLSLRNQFYLQQKF